MFSSNFPSFASDGSLSDWPSQACHFLSCQLCIGLNHKVVVGHPYFLAGHISLLKVEPRKFTELFSWNWLDFSHFVVLGLICLGEWWPPTCYPLRKQNTLKQPETNRLLEQGRFCSPCLMSYLDHMSICQHISIDWRSM